MVAELLLLLRVMGLPAASWKEEEEEEDDGRRTSTASSADPAAVESRMAMDLQPKGMSCYEERAGCGMYTPAKNVGGRSFFYCVL